MDRLFTSTAFFFFLVALVHAAEIKDLRELKQDHSLYTRQAAYVFNHLNLNLQREADAFFNKRFFSPWHQRTSHFTKEDITQEFEKYGKDPGYGSDGKRHTKAWMKRIIKNAALNTYPAAGYPAITVENGDLRVLPTMEKHLFDPRNSSLPFDNLQNSGVSVGTPLYISHMTQDKKWVLAETHYAIGWLLQEKIAKVDENFIAIWEKGPYITVIKERARIERAGGKPLLAPLGSFFPLLGEEGESFRILIARRNAEGHAETREALISHNVCAPKPLSLSATNMAAIANELLNQPYGWGGLDAKRDCSSTLMDLFAPFGLWLPRNSGHQATMTGALIDLKGLTPEEKKKVILEQGIPYFTLLWLKGHIMLYIGSQEGNPIVFHNFWSVKENHKKIIVGRAAITTLNPNGDGKEEILRALRGMVLLWPPPREIEENF